MVVEMKKAAPAYSQSSQFNVDCETIVSGGFRNVVVHTVPSSAVVGERAIGTGETSLVGKEYASLYAFVRRHKEFLKTSVTVIVSAGMEMLDGRRLGFRDHVEPERRSASMRLLERIAEHGRLQVLRWPVFAPHPCGCLEIDDGVVSLVAVVVERSLLGDDHVKFSDDGL